MALPAVNFSSSNAFEIRSPASRSAISSLLLGINHNESSHASAALDLVTEIRLSPPVASEEQGEVNLWVKLKKISCPVKASALTHPFTPRFEELQNPKVPKRTEP